MFLAIDIGNTNILFGIYSNDCLIETFRIKSSQDAILPQELDFLKKYDIKECVICSVVTELDSIITSSIYKLFKIKPLFVSANIKTGFKINVNNPENVGADRLANVCASSKLYPLPSVVIDAGSAITFDALNSSNTFCGGIIMPGLYLQLKSLHSNTSKLPLINIENIDKLIGNNTKTSILSGVVNGTASALDGLIQKFKNELGEKTVIIGTGGDINFLNKYMNNKFDYINHNLTLEGIRYIKELNL